MALDKGPAAPHPHNVFWTGLLAFGGTVTALGSTLTGLAKPSSGPFDLWTYPATVVAYFGVTLALIGFIGLIRGWNFPFARRQVSTNPVRRNSMYEEGNVTSVSAYNAAGELTGIKRMDIQKARLRPDFAPEWAERDRLMALCSGTNEESEAVEAWTKSVYTKLRSWKPSKAMEFRPDESSVTKYPEQAHIKLPPVVRSLLQGLDTNRSRQQLTMYGERLAKILDED